jgi:hypothetical protein
MTSRIHGSFSRLETGFLDLKRGLHLLLLRLQLLPLNLSVRNFSAAFLRAKFEYGLVVDVVGPSRAFQANPQHQRVKFDY